MRNAQIKKSNKYITVSDIDNATVLIDKIDSKIIELMVLGKTNREISLNIKIPLSTIQRRTRNLLNKNIVISEIYINYEKFGFRTGMLHIYLANDSIYKTAEEINKIQGITSTEIHIGNSDIIAFLIYKQNSHLLNIINTVKKMDGVNKIIWSEKVYSVPSNISTYNTVN